MPQTTNKGDQILWFFTTLECYEGDDLSDLPFQVEQQPEEGLLSVTACPRKCTVGGRALFAG